MTVGFCFVLPPGESFTLSPGGIKNFSESIKNLD